MWRNFVMLREECLFTLLTFDWQIWYDNVPHSKLIEYKKDQNWVRRSDDYLVFPGGGTQFKEGVNKYIQFIEEVQFTLSSGLSLLLLC